MLASSSPRCFAGNCVLLRLCMPRYPPWALCSLTTNFSIRLLGFGLSFYRLIFSIPLSCSRYLLSTKYYLTSFDFYAVFKVLYLKTLLSSRLSFNKCWIASLTFLCCSQMEVSGLEPLTSCLQSRRSTNWAKPPHFFYSPFTRNIDIRWAIPDSNQRPHPYQGCALTNWANSPYYLDSISLFGFGWTRI
jgi:hypothetical protein